MTGESRYKWHHCPQTPEDGRISITFRTVNTGVIKSLKSKVEESPKLVEKLKSKKPPKKRRKIAKDLPEGALVSALWTDGIFYPAQIRGKSKKGYRVKFDDYSGIWDLSIEKVKDRSVSTLDKKNEGINRE